MFSSCLHGKGIIENPNHPLLLEEGQRFGNLHCADLPSRGWGYGLPTETPPVGEAPNRQGTHLTRNYLGAQPLQRQGT